MASRIILKSALHSPHPDKGMAFYSLHIVPKIKAMKQDKSKIKEPYSPENTPSPPQIIEPNQRKERNEGSRPVEDRQKNQTTGENKSAQKKEEKPKPLSESETGIDDETTI
jgi:hypothetical protein